MAITCPKCGHEQEESSTCIKCGIIFAKFKQVQDREPEEEQRAGPVQVPLHERTSVKDTSFPVVPVIFLVVIVCAAVFVYFKYIEPSMVAGNFKDSLEEFGAEKFDIPREDPLVEEGEVPYRTGKVFVVRPQYKYPLAPGRYKTFEPEIHAVWYMLDRSMRATGPDEVDTLIRIRRKLRKAQRYQKKGGFEQKVVSIHIHYLDVFNWQEQTYIGTWKIDPGGNMGEEVTEEELDEKIALTSDEALLEFIESMPEI